MTKPDVPTTAPPKGQIDNLPGSSAAPDHRSIRSMNKNKNLDGSSRGRLSLNLQVARTLHGWSQEQLGLRCGLKRTYIGALERGEINPGVDNLDRIAEGLGIDCYVLLLSPDQAQPLLYQQMKSGR
jgi:ribosome-binding protein aMBF1 (putative translation factor)